MEIDVGSLRCMAPSLGIPPSRHYDPSDAEDAALRLDWAKFLFRAGYRLRYPQETTGTAVLLFHRFLIQERVGKHQRSRDVILTTCLFLAGKVTEAPRRLRDVINVLHMLTCTGQDEPPLLDKAYWTMKERIVEFEQVLLRTINFQVDPPDPYRLILNYARSLRLGRAATRTAWGLANDVLFCPRALSAPPPAVACAAIRMAARVHGADRRLRWFSPAMKNKRRRTNDSGGFGTGGGDGSESVVDSGGGGAGIGGGGGGSGGGDGGNEEQHGQAKREVGGDGRGGAAVTVAATATAAGEGAPVVTLFQDSGNHNSYGVEREATATEEGLGVGAGVGGGSETTVGKRGCPPGLSANEDKSAGEGNGGQQIVAGANAAAADDAVFVGGDGSSVTGGGSSGGVGGGNRGRDGGVSGGDGGKDDERETMPWWGLFDARDEEIELVCSELLALYKTHDAKGGGNGGITDIGGRPDGGGGGSGADRGVAQLRRRDGDVAEVRGGTGVGDGSRVNGLGVGVGVRGVVEDVSSVSSADSSRRRNGSRQ